MSVGGIAINTLNYKKNTTRTVKYTDEILLKCAYLI